MLTRSDGSLPAPTRALWLVGALALFTLPVHAGSEVVTEGVVVSGFRAWEIAVMAIGSGGLVLAALRDGIFARLLASPLCVWLGKISYSLYLMHLTILLVGVHFVDAPVGWPQGLGLLAVVLVVTLPLSALTYRAIEAPAIRAGRALCRWIDR